MMKKLIFLLRKNPKIPPKFSIFSWGGSAPQTPRIYEVIGATTIGNFSVWQDIKFEGNFSLEGSVLKEEVTEDHLTLWPWWQNTDGARWEAEIGGFDDSMAIKSLSFLQNFCVENVLAFL